MGDIFGDPVVATALLDRLLHQADVIRIEGAEPDGIPPARGMAVEGCRSGNCLSKISRAQ